MNEKRKLSDEKLSKVNGGFRKTEEEGTLRDLLSHIQRGQHMDPGKYYTCKNCQEKIPKSGEVGDNTAVICPKCGWNVR